MRKGLAIVVALSMVLALFTFNFTVSAATATISASVVGATEVEAGDTVQVVINAVSETNFEVLAFDINIPEQLELVSFTAGAGVDADGFIPRSGPGWGAVAPGAADRLAVVQDAAPAVSPFVTLNFEVREGAAGGPAAITITGVEAFAPGGAEVVYTAQNTSVTIITNDPTINLSAPTHWLYDSTDTFPVVVNFANAPANFEVLAFDINIPAELELVSFTAGAGVDADGFIPRSGPGWGAVAPGAADRLAVVQDAAPGVSPFVTLMLRLRNPGDDLGATPVISISGIEAFAPGGAEVDFVAGSATINIVDELPAPPGVRTFVSVTPNPVVVPFIIGTHDASTFWAAQTATVTVNYDLVDAEGDVIGSGTITNVELDWDNFAPTGVDFATPGTRETGASVALLDLPADVVVTAPAVASVPVSIMVTQLPGLVTISHNSRNQGQWVEITIIPVPGQDSATIRIGSFSVTIDVDYTLPSVTHRITLSPAATFPIGNHTVYVDYYDYTGATYTSEFPLAINPPQHGGVITPDRDIIGGAGGGGTTEPECEDCERYPCICNNCPVYGTYPCECVDVERYPFDDVGNNATRHWAHAYINALEAANIVRGIAPRTFAPNANITRGEFATMLVRFMGLSPNAAGVPFNDVAGHWAAGYVNAAFNAGVVLGFSYGHFGVDYNITRQDMATMIYRAFSAYFAAEGPADFSDFNLVDEWAVDAVAAFAMAGVVTGFPDGTFRPTSNATRAEAATMIYRLMALVDAGVITNGNGNGYENGYED